MKVNWKDKALIESACQEAKSVAEILKKLGLPTTGDSSKTLKKYAVKYGIVLPDGNSKNARSGKAVPLDKILIYGTTVNGPRLVTRLVNQGIINYKCNLCNNDGNWMGKAITLQLDHIDGDNKNNILSNLRLLCPNCHTQTETWGRKNRMVAIV